MESGQARTEGRPRRWYAVAVTLLALWSAAPLAVTLLQISVWPDEAGTEDIPVPERPRTLSGWLRLPGKFKWYFQEQFGLKASYAAAQGWLSLRWLGKSPSPTALLGKDGWLFLASERTLDYQRHSDPFGEAALDEWTRVLCERDRWLTERKTEFVFFVAPNKHTVYSEHLPDDLAANASRTRLDQLLTALSTRCPELATVDVRHQLREAREHAQLYFKTDTHWNPAAGWVAANEIARQLGKPPLSGDLLRATAVRTEGGDLARVSGVQHHLADTEVWAAPPPNNLTDEHGKPVTWKMRDIRARARLDVRNRDGEGTAVVVRDSYGEALIPWVSLLFRRTVWIWSYEFSAEDVMREKPDVVIQQLVERKLMTVAADGRPL